MPVRGFIVWNNHSFNLTKKDTSVEQWLNVEFAAPEQQRYPRVQIFDASEIFGMGRIDAFTSKEICNTYTIPRYARLLTLSTHTHRRGKRFRVWYPPNGPTVLGGAMPRGSVSLVISSVAAASEPSLMSEK